MDSKNIDKYFNTEGTEKGKEMVRNARKRMKGVERKKRHLKTSFSLLSNLSPNFLRLQ